jgi:outer membrane protein OmpA-like peptidoglycan-associated protein
MMKTTFAGLAAALSMFVVQLQTVTPADACGVKLIVKTPNPRQAVARSSRPSDVLLLGTPSHRLTRDLSARGHKVEVATDAGSAKRQNYAAVMTDQAHADAARAKFGNEVVVVYADSGSDAQRVETLVARRPVAADKNRTVVAAQINRKPIAAGPEEKGSAKTMVASKEPNETPAVATPKAPEKQPEKVVKAPEKAPEPEKVAVKAPEPKPEKTPEPKPEKVTTNVAPPVETKRPAEKVQAPSKLREEMYFGMGSASIQRKTSIARAVKWLAANASGSIMIEGHADPTGTPEGNQVLSQNRADAVKDAIVSEGGDASRIEVQAFGDTKLKYGRSDGRNRRVSIEAKP